LRDDVTWADITGFLPPDPTVNAMLVWNDGSKIALWTRNINNYI